MPISNLWKSRILALRENGNGFTYDEIAAMSDISRSNVSVAIRKMLSEDPEIVEREECEDGRVRFTFNYAALDVEGTVDEVAPDIPEWLSPETYHNILNRISISDEEEIKVEHVDWIKQFQRGGLRIMVFEKGQKIPEYEKVLRVDNCIVLT